MIRKKELISFKQRELQKYKKILKAYKFITTDYATLTSFNFLETDKCIYDSLLHFEENINFNSEELIEKFEIVKQGYIMSYSSAIMPYAKEEQDLRLKSIIGNYLKDKEGIYKPTKWVNISSATYLSLSDEARVKHINYLLSGPSDIETFENGHGLCIKHNIFAVPYSLYLLSKFHRNTINEQEEEEFSRMLRNRN